MIGRLRTALYMVGGGRGKETPDLRDLVRHPTVKHQGSTPMGDAHLASILYMGSFNNARLNAHDPSLQARALEAIRNPQRETVLQGFDAFQRFQGTDRAANNQWALRTWRGVTRQHIENLLDAIPSRTRYAMAVSHVGATGAILNKGWPDLTLAGNETWKLIEIKTSDRLHASQIATMSYLKYHHDLPIEIWKVRAGSSIASKARA